MEKFTHIEAFYQVCRSTKKANTDPQCPEKYKVTTPVTYRGTVKLHGTNAGVSLTPEALVPQSRNRELSVDNDSLGWAKFVMGKAQTKAIREIEARIRAAEGLAAEDKLTIFGEWCGPGIQKGCAIHKTPTRQWVMFAVVLGEGENSRYIDAVPRVGNEFADAHIYSILDGPTWELTVDYTDRASKEAAAQKATELTAMVERQCPWSIRFESDGVGEGIVWTPVGKHWGRTDLWFKTKGEKHKKVGAGKKKTQVNVDPEVLANAQGFVDLMVTEDRLSQGVDYLREHGMGLEPSSIGPFLKWVNEDVRREGDAELEANSLNWKVVSKMVSKTARNWFLSSIKNTL